MGDEFDSYLMLIAISRAQSAICGRYPRDSPLADHRGMLSRWFLGLCVGEESWSFFVPLMPTAEPDRPAGSLMITESPKLASQRRVMLDSGSSVVLQSMELIAFIRGVASRSPGIHSLNVFRAHGPSILSSGGAADRSFVSVCTQSGHVRLNPAKPRG